MRAMLRLYKEREAEAAQEQNNCNLAKKRAREKALDRGKSLSVRNPHRQAVKPAVSACTVHHGKRMIGGRRALFLSFFQIIFAKALDKSSPATYYIINISVKC